MELLTWNLYLFAGMFMVRVCCRAAETAGDVVKIKLIKKGGI